MSKLDHAKRNLQEKLRRQRGEQISKRKPKKATPKQISLLKKLGIEPDKNMNRLTASNKIKEALNNV